MNSSGLGNIPFEINHIRQRLAALKEKQQRCQMALVVSMNDPLGNII